MYNKKSLSDHFYHERLNMNFVKKIFLLFVVSFVSFAGAETLAEKIERTCSYFEQRFTNAETIKDKNHTLTYIRLCFLEVSDFIHAMYDDLYADESVTEKNGFRANKAEWEALAQSYENKFNQLNNLLSFEDRIFLAFGEYKPDYDGGHVR